MSMIRVIGEKFLELSLSPEEVNTLQEAGVRLYGVPRRHGVWRCSFRYIDKVLLHLRGWTEDNMDHSSSAYRYLVDEQRRQVANKLLKAGKVSCK